ncbi:pyrin-like isoform X2 [Sparus aurata]|uniref:pyrin-like isoform X2 n=1 Tax=Sparus aurata TaxID=8175 RepID=UPI0011C0EBD9|nr:pyrin-like isoform X2 [Sparus aurata]XP_030285427.1 pyrin-like isoform X2 [Sparus aurata]XP_030285436.1 pyrin-like isoform X2 [Sparus aurata]
MLVSQLLLGTLEKLRQDDFETLKFYLSENVLDGCNPIPQSHLENASRVQTARKMIDTYGEDLAVKVTVKILKDMNCNGPKQELESRYAAGKPATPAPSSSSSSSSSAAAPPSAPGVVIAQDRSVIIAPNGTMGALNITINK